MLGQIGRRLGIGRKERVTPNDVGFAGQWVGTTDEDDSPVILDLDDGYPNARGTGRIHFKGTAGAITEFEIPRDALEVNLENIPLHWIHPDGSGVLNTPDMRKARPEDTFPESANVSIKRNGHAAELVWNTPISTHGRAMLSRAPGNIVSTVPAMEIDSWGKFREWAVQQTPHAFLFRGQPENYRLRTAFHRTYRKDLLKYAVEDIPLAHKQLTAQTRHLFDLNVPAQRGAFWNLLQHHGYPTPLLDWTFSPFVAAFFAYRRRQALDAPSDKVRIFAFDRAAWQKLPQFDKPNLVPLHFSILDALAIENKRAIPQQALSTLTNADHIEGYIQSLENLHQRRYLYAIDLPASLRPQVMVELSLMGITAGSLFPGLDGACEELRGRMFHPQIAPGTS